MRDLSADWIQVLSTKVPAQPSTEVGEKERKNSVRNRRGKSRKGTRKGGRVEGRREGGNHSQTVRGRATAAKSARRQESTQMDEMREERRMRKGSQALTTVRLMTSRPAFAMSCEWARTSQHPLGELPRKSAHFIRKPIVDVLPG